MKKPCDPVKTQRLLMVSCSLVLAASCSLVTTIPPRNMTVGAMTETQVRIHMYMTANRTYPADLSVLPTRDGYANRTTDGWGRPLIFSIDDRGIISLASLGRDGKVGGEGDDADIIRRYRTKNEDGALNIDDDFWIVHSEIRDDGGGVGAELEQSEKGDITDSGEVEGVDNGRLPRGGENQ